MALTLPHTIVLIAYTCMYKDKRRFYISDVAGNLENIHFGINSRNENRLSETHDYWKHMATRYY